MKVSALIEKLNGEEVVVTREIEGHYYEVGDQFTGYYHDENGNEMSETGEILDILIQE